MFDWRPRPAKKPKRIFENFRFRIPESLHLHVRQMEFSQGYKATMLNHSTRVCSITDGPSAARSNRTLRMSSLYWCRDSRMTSISVGLRLENFLYNFRKFPRKIPPSSQRISRRETVLLSTFHSVHNKFQYSKVENFLFHSQ